MKKVIIFIVICGLISGCVIDSSKQKTFSGILEVTEGTMGGDGYDSCLGSPYYKIKLSSGKEIMIDPSLILTNESDFENFENLLGKEIKITGKHIKKKSVLNEPNDNMMQREIFPNTKSISCNHIEIIELEVLQ